MTTMDQLLSAADRAEQSAAKPIDWKRFRRLVIANLLAPFFFLGWLLGKTFFVARFVWKTMQEGFATGYRPASARPTVDG